VSERYDLAKLMAACDEAINAASNAELKGACVNWGDLSCVDAQYYESVHGDSGHRVLIEEADPNNYPFCKFVGEHLALAGYPHVEVTTEW